MPEFLVTESNSVAITAVDGTVAPTSGAFTLLGVSRAGTSSSGVGQPILGTYGVLFVNANGTFGYQLNNDDPDTNLLGTGMSAIERFTFTYSLNGVIQTDTLQFQINGIDELGQVITDSATAILGASHVIDSPHRYTFTSVYGFLLDGDYYGQPFSFLNQGAILTSSATDEAITVAFWDFSTGPANIVNQGLIEARSSRTATGLSNNSLGPVINDGVIRAIGTGTGDGTLSNRPGGAVGLGTYFHGETVINNGTIEAISAHGGAAGINSGSLHTTIQNNGYIYASTGAAANAEWAAAGIISGQSDNVNIINTGTIHAVSTNGAGTFGITLFPDSTNPYRYANIVNSGTIVAVTAIQAIDGYSTGIHVTNSGRIEGNLNFNHNLNIVTNNSSGVWVGNLQFGVDHDILVNRGMIAGTVSLGPGFDFFDGRGGVATGIVFGGVNRDRLVGGTAADALDAGGDSDIVEGGGGADLLTGGSGSDLFVYSAASDSTVASRDVISDFESGIDILDLSQLSPTSVSLTPSIGGSIVNAQTSAGLLSIEVRGTLVASDIVTGRAPGDVIGTGDSDTLIAYGGNVAVRGFDGNDFMHGSNGANLMDGGTGWDMMFGGSGDDIYLIDNHDDRVFELADGGIDEIWSSIGYTLQAYTENLVLVGAFDVDGLGNQLDNRMVGNSGSNALTAENGNDVLIGGAGADRLFGGGGSDRFVYAVWTESIASQTDYIYRFERDFDTIDIGALGPVWLTFTPFVNYWTASDWTTVSITTGAGTTVIRVDGLVDHTDFTMVNGPTLGSNGNDDVSGSVVGDWIEGRAGDDLLLGMAGSDSLRGDDGNDSLFGGLGNDVLTGGPGADSFHFTDALSATTNVDRIADFGAGDIIVLDRSVFSGLELGNLSETAFSNRGFSQSSAHRILYDSFSGELFYDPDGIFGADPIRFALVPAGTTLTAASFHVSQATAPEPEVTHPHSDFNGEGRSDLLLRSTNGGFTVWRGQANGSLAGTDGLEANPVDPNWAVAGIGDFNGDGRSDILWRHSSGVIGEWLGQAGPFTNNSGVAANPVDNGWSTVGIADYNGDGRDDILWRHSSGEIGQWLGQSNGSFANNGGAAANAVDPTWVVVANGDFNRDGRADILWQHSSGAYVEWQGSATGKLNNVGTVLTGVTGSVVGSGDFNGDGYDDILMRNPSTGALTGWMGQAGGQFGAVTSSQAISDLNWKIVAIGDYNGDGRDDLIWKHSSGVGAQWLGTAAGDFVYNGAVPTIPVSWTVQSPDIWPV